MSDRTPEVGPLTAGESSMQRYRENRSEDPSSASPVAPSQPGDWEEGLAPYGVQTWHLPGQGDAGPRCGEYYPKAVCDSCGEPEFASHLCGRRSCPSCWTLWARDAAVRVTERIQQFRHTQPDNHRRQVAQAYVSPPEGEVSSEREYWDGRSKAADIAEAKGFRGFCIIPHGYRVLEDGKEAYRDADPDYGVWVWLRNDVEDMQRFITWSPHYHIIGATSQDMTPAQDSDEWVYQFKRSLSSYSGVTDVDSHESVYGLSRYLLSHTTFPADSQKQVITWYGDLANSVFVEDATEDWQHQKPSQGVRDALERHITEMANSPIEDDVDDDAPDRDQDDDVLERCDQDDCDGELIDVFDVAQYLRQKDPPKEVRDRMEAARDWRLGRRLPPPGLKNPTTEEQAQETFEHLV